MISLLHELFVSRVLCLFVSISFGYMIGKVKFFGFNFGTTLGTLFIAMLVSYFGGIIDPHGEPILYSMFLFSVGYDGGENLPRVFNKAAIRSIFLSIIVMLSAFVTLAICAKLFHLSKGMVVGIAAGSLTQSAIIQSSSDTLATVINNYKAFDLHQYNIDVAEGFSVSYFFGLTTAIIWCGLLVEFIFRRKLSDEGRLVGVTLGNPYSKKHSSPKNSLLVLCNGIIVGTILSFISFNIFGVTIKLGITGCLISGLIFGWINHKHPSRLVIDKHSIRLTQDFGLAGFIAAIGVSTGKQVIHSLASNGYEVILISILVAIVPLIVATFFGYFILREKNLALLSGAIAGARTASPASGVVISKAGNNAPMQSFMVPFLLSSILLTFLGPIIILLL